MNDINILCLHRLKVVQEQFKQTLVDVVVLLTNLNFVEQTSSYNHIQILRASPRSVKALKLYLE